MDIDYHGCDSISDCCGPAPLVQPTPAMLEAFYKEMLAHMQGKTQQWVVNNGDEKIQTTYRLPTSEEMYIFPRDVQCIHRGGGVMILRMSLWLVAEDLFYDEDGCLVGKKMSTRRCPGEVKIVVSDPDAQNPLARFMVMGSIAASSLALLGYMFRDQIQRLLQ